MTKRYTAILKIVEVEERESGSQPRRHSDGAPNPNASNNSELLAVTLRSKDLASLKVQLAAHVDLAQE